MYSGLYVKDELFSSAEKVQGRLLRRHGVAGHAVALRWIMHHSALDGGKGDGMTMGASNDWQLEENLKYCQQGPLPDEVVKAIEDSWVVMKPVAPLLGRRRRGCETPRR